jgi:hypothetical protein
MATLSEEKLIWSIGHLLKHGDTDIFPYPLEFNFLEARKAEVAKALASLDIATYKPMSVLESLVPKSRYNFRVAHQLYPIDNVLLTGAVYSISSELEACRLPIGDGPFSYRCSPNDEIDLFAENCRFGDWLQAQFFGLRFSDDKYTHIVEADISEFYQRIYHHRLDNSVSAATSNQPTAKFIKTFISHVRAKQSFGIPVGGNASRMLAEVLLNDTDRAIRAEGYDFTRYVDDFRIYIQRGQDPSAALAFLSEHLMTNEGLFLAAAKTRVHSLAGYLDNLSISSGEDTSQADESAAHRLLQEIYESENSEQAVEALKSEDLVGDLEAELGKNFWDVGKIRVLIRCMKLTKAHDAADFIKKNLRRLLPFIRDVVLLIEELVKAGEVQFNDLADDIVKIIFEPASQHLAVTRAWLLELFIRKAVPLTQEQARPLYDLNGSLDVRSILTLRGQLFDIGYFRRQKTRIDELNGWAQPALIYGARCLPPDI